MALNLAPQFGNPPITKKEAFTLKQRESNSYSRENEPSPVFSFKNGSMVSGSVEVFDFFEDKPEIRKYGIMQNLVITNSSGKEILLFLNQDNNRVFVIPAGVIRSFDQNEISGGISSVRIKNNDGSGTISANEITVEVFRKGIEFSTIFQKIHKRIFKIGGF